MPTLSPPPITGQPMLDRWLSLLHKIVTARVAPSSIALETLGNYASDVAAAAGGVAIGGMYRNGGALMVRVS